MKLTCPRCSQKLELSPEDAALLRAEPSFPCPTCGGLLALPAVVTVPMPQGSAAQTVPSPMKVPMPQQPAAKGPPLMTAAAGRNPVADVLDAYHGMNRNLRILGVSVLMLLGGLGIYMALKPGGDVHNTRQQILREVIRNQYFTDLIASGATTEKELLGLWDIRAYGIGFVGLTEEQCAWDKAPELAKRMGASVLNLDPPDAASRTPLLYWLTDFSADLGGTTHWLMDHGEPKVLHAPELSRVTTMERPRRVLLAWNGSAGKN